MTLFSQREVDNTRKKLQLLEDLYAAHELDRDEDERVRRLSMRSLKRMINQLKEEIIRFEVKAPAKTTSG